MFEEKKKTQFQDTALEAARKYEILRSLKKVKPEDYYQRNNINKFDSVLLSDDVAKKKLSNCVHEAFSIRTYYVKSRSQRGLFYELSWTIEFKAMVEAGEMVALELRKVLNGLRKDEKEALHVSFYEYPSRSSITISKERPIKNVKKSLLWLWEDLKDVKACYPYVVDFIKQVR